MGMIIVIIMVTQIQMKLDKMLDFKWTALFSISVNKFEQELASTFGDKQKPKEVIWCHKRVVK